MQILSPSYLNWECRKKSHGENYPQKKPWEEK